VSVINPINSLVYIYASVPRLYKPTRIAILAREQDDYVKSIALDVAGFDSFGISVTCEFHHKHRQALTNQARFFWQVHTVTGIVCDIPDFQDSPETYTPRLVINGEQYFANTALRVLQELPLKHTFCSCLMLWKRSEFMLEYLAYYTAVHGLAHTIVIVQDLETMEELEWLKAFFSLETHYWPHMYTQPSMMSYCSVLAQQKCEWVSQWDIDEFLHTDEDVRLTSALLRTPDSIHSIIVTLHFVQMFANETVTLTPPGGVLRNFKCSMSATISEKSILRLANMHPSFINKVHWFFGPRTLRIHT
jgi:hypothetical protein